MISQIPKNKKLIFFDGICNMCNSSVQFIIKYDTKNQFVFASLQGETSKNILEKLQIENKKLTSIILLENDDFYNKSTAVLKIASELKTPINFIAIFLIVPKFIRDSIYDIVKENRYKWFGKKTQCSIPSPELRKRFLP